jgi:hypothetical protein
MTEPRNPLEVVEEALAGLLTKLDEVDEATRGVFALAHIHGMEYTGPTYGSEVLRAYAALALVRKMWADAVVGWALYGDKDSAMFPGRPFAWIATELQGEGIRPALLFPIPDSTEDGDAQD